MERMASNAVYRIALLRASLSRTDFSASFLSLTLAASTMPVIATIPIKKCSTGMGSCVPANHAAPAQARHAECRAGDRCYDSSPKKETENVVDTIKQSWRADVMAHQENRQDRLDHVGERNPGAGQHGNAVELRKDECSQANR